MIQTWWIRRWYFLYISVCMILRIAALFKSFQFSYITYFSQYIVLQTTCFIQLILLGYSFNHTLFFQKYISTIVFQMIYKQYNQQGS